MSPPKQKPFGVSRSNIPILEYPISRVVQTGIGFSTREGMVSQYEEWAAAKDANISLWDWDEPGKLPTWFKEKVVAHYRLSRAIADNVLDAQNQKMKRRNTGG